MSKNRHILAHADKVTLFNTVAENRYVGCVHSLKRIKYWLCHRLSEFTIITDNSDFRNSTFSTAPMENLKNPTCQTDEVEAFCSHSDCILTP